MAKHELAGKPVPLDLLPDIPDLISRYYLNKPDMQEAAQQVSFGTSGHRGTSLDSTFTESHILAITQAICDYRKKNNIDGPLFLGKDTHALSNPAEKTAIEVLAANDVTVQTAQDRFTPTPVISHAILTNNAGRKSGLADGIVITPSHNPPDNGGFKYNPPSGGPAGSEITQWVADRANELLKNDLRDVKRMPYERARKHDNIKSYDFVTPYVDDLQSIIDLDAVKNAGLNLGADALGGAGLGFWQPIAETYGLNIDLRNADYDPTFRFMRVDGDGVIRMDCSSPHAMAGLIDLKDQFDLAFGNDPDFDRHGIVTRSSGLLNPNHYLSVAISYLFQNRPDWPKGAAVGKTLVSSSMIDRVAKSLNRKLAEVPVGFKWFVDGLLNGSYGFGGEESAGASFLRKNGSAWSTDKDGIIMCLLAAEIMAKTDKDPGELYTDLTEKHGAPLYTRLQAPATFEEKEKLKSLSEDQIKATDLAGEKIVDILTHAPANKAAIGGLKVATENGWFAARPSGTEMIYKIYAESFKGEHHLNAITDAAQEIVADALK